MEEPVCSFATLRTKLKASSERSEGMEDWKQSPPSVQSLLHEGSGSFLLSSFYPSQALSHFLENLKHARDYPLFRSRDWQQSLPLDGSG